MERIQAAIARARQAREASGAASPARSSVLAPGGWGAMPRHEISRAHMERMRLSNDAASGDFTAFDVLRTRAMKLMKAKGWTRLAITSPTPACGKSTVALNLGFSLARREDVSALLFEADLRRPSLAQKINLDPPHAVCDVLTGVAPLAENACRLAQRFAVSTGRADRNRPANLLQSPRVGPALQAIQDQYRPTVMLFDTPPLLAGDDTIAFLQNVDCVLLVAAAEQTTIKEIDACEREIANYSNVLGVLLNKCRFNDEGYGYAYED